MKKKERKEKGFRRFLPSVSFLIKKRGFPESRRSTAREKKTSAECPHLSRRKKEKKSDALFLRAFEVLGKKGESERTVKDFISFYVSIAIEKKKHL